MPSREQNSSRLFRDAIGVSDADPAKRTLALLEIIAVLMQEVEALRRVAARTAPREYAEAYEAAAEVTHDSAGVTPGIEKLLALFVDSPPDRRREEVLLTTLGYAQGDLDRVAQRLSQLETLT